LKAAPNPSCDGITGEQRATGNRKRRPAVATFSSLENNSCFVVDYIDMQRLSQSVCIPGNWSKIKTFTFAGTLCVWTLGLQSRMRVQGITYLEQMAADMQCNGLLTFNRNKDGIKKIFVET
jgi:hypothetical protein